MTFNQNEIISLVQNFTNRTISGSITPVSFGPNELIPYKDIPQGSEYETNQVLFGCIEMLYTDGGNGLNLTARGVALNENNQEIRVDKTTLSVDKKQKNTAFRAFENVLFDKINGEIDEDTEIHFSGYLINLVDL